MTYSQDHRLPLVVLISGNGSNLQAIIDAIDNGMPAKIRAVVSNQEDAYGLERAEKADIATFVLTHDDYPERRDYDRALAAIIDTYAPKLIILAGFMRILSQPFVHHYQGQILNIHPSLLPKHPGLNTHQRVLELGETEHGTTVHIVTEELDSGPTLAQAKISVTTADTIESLKARVQKLEHQLYPQVIADFCSGKLNN